MAGRRMRPTPSTAEAPEKEYQRLNPGAGGSPSQQQERQSKRNPKTTRHDEAALPGGSNADLRGTRRKRRPVAGGV